jgi:hypothetical protein
MEYNMKLTTIETGIVVFVASLITAFLFTKHTPVVKVIRYDTPAPYDTIVVWPELGR